MTDAIKKYVPACINDEYYLLKLDESHHDLDRSVTRRMEEFLPITTMRTKYALIEFLTEVGADILYLRPRECPPRLDLMEPTAANKVSEYKPTVGLRIRPSPVGESVGVVPQRPVVVEPMLVQ